VSSVWQVSHALSHLCVKLSHTILCRFNLSHTVADLQLRVLSLGGHRGAPFSLAAGFPLQTLTDPRATIESAGLKGAAVTQQAAT
jgi:hypothetical protein